MSSMIRRIARTIAKRKNSRKIGVHFAGRGSKLGVTNPKDPCRTGKRKAPKAWRGQGCTFPVKPKLVPAEVNMGRTKPCNRPWLGFDRENLTAVHRAKMQRKAGQRAADAQSGSEPGRVARLLDIPAGMNRHTGKPHEHKREIARRGGGQ